MSKAEIHSNHEVHHRSSLHGRCHYPIRWQAFLRNQGWCQVSCPRPILERATSSCNRVLEESLPERLAKKRSCPPYATACKSKSTELLFKFKGGSCDSDTRKPRMTWFTACAKTLVKVLHSATTKHFRSRNNVLTLVASPFKEKWPTISVYDYTLLHHHRKERLYQCQTKGRRCTVE